MDKLRALQYFVASAREGSFSAAARRLDVSLPAVAKLVTALERELGAALFERTPRGLTLTAEGASYLDTCRPLLERLAEADESIGAGAARPRGTVVLGMPEFVLQNCIAEALPRFHARFPDIHLDLRLVTRPKGAAAEGVDVLVLVGWHESGDWIRRRIAQTRYHVVAAPSYWASRGVPARPADLARHACFCFRNPEGTLLDLWEFERGGEVESVAVSGWLSGAHRDALLHATLAGHGVARVTGITAWQHVTSGRLVAALQDWRSRHAPPVHAFWRPQHRRTPRIRHVVDFVSELFAHLEATRERGGDETAMPAWQGKHYARASRSTGA